MGRAAPLLLLVLTAGSLSACDWLSLDRDNPWDQQRCSPGCPKGKRCFEGECHPADAGAADMGGDVLLPDQKITDGFSGPSCRQPCAMGKICDENCWCWENPLSGTRQLNAITGGKGFLIAVGEKGTVLQQDHNGWRAFQITDRDLLAVWADNAYLIYAVGENGAVFKYEYNKWSQVEDDALGDGDLRGVWGSSASDVHVVGVKGKAVHFDRKSWKAYKVGTSSSVDFNAVWGREGGTEAYAVGQNGWVSVWQGRIDGWKWVATLPKDKNYNAAWVSAAGEVWVVGDGGAVLRRTKGTWGLEPTSFTTSKLTHVWGKGASVWFTTFDGEIHRWDGAQYQKVYDGASDIITDKQLNGIWGFSASEIHAVGNLGKVVRHDGKTWRPALPGITDVLHAVWVTPAGDVYAGGYQGRLLVREAGVWREEKPAPLTSGACGSELEVGGKTYQYRSLYRTWGTARTNIFAAGDGHLLRYDGSKWEDLTDTAGLTKAAAPYIADQKTDHLCWWGVWGASGSDVWASGGSKNSRDTTQGKRHVRGFMAHYDGTSWTLQTPAKAGQWSTISAVWAPSATEVYAAGLHGQLLARKGAAWKVLWGLSATDAQGKHWQYWNLHGLWGSGATNIYTVGVVAADKATSTPHKGSVFRYDGKDFKKSLADLPEIRLGAIWGTGPTDVFAVGQSFNIHHHDGAKWTAVVTGAKSDYRGDLFAVGANKAGDVYVVGKYGTIYRRCGKN